MKRWIATVLMAGIILVTTSCQLQQQEGIESSNQSVVSKSELSELISNEPYENAYSFRADTLSEFVTNFKAYDIDNVLSPKASYPDKEKDPYRYQKLKGYTDMITEMQTEGIVLPFYKNNLSESDKFSMLIESGTFGSDKHYIHKLYYEDLVFWMSIGYVDPIHLEVAKTNLNEYNIKRLEKYAERKEVEDYLQRTSQVKDRRIEPLEINNSIISGNFFTSITHEIQYVRFFLENNYLVSIYISKRGSDGSYNPINIDNELLKNISFKKVKLGELEKYADGSKASSQTPNPN